jgi:hypothetical protein
MFLYRVQMQAADAYVATDLNQTRAAPITAGGGEAEPSSTAFDDSKCVHTRAACRPLFFSLSGAGVNKAAAVGGGRRWCAALVCGAGVRR